MKKTLATITLILILIAGIIIYMLSINQTANYRDIGDTLKGIGYKVHEEVPGKKGPNDKFNSIKIYKINEEETVNLCEYSSYYKAKEDLQILTGPLIDFRITPHFYWKSRFIVVYVGKDEHLINDLGKILGSEYVTEKNNAKEKLATVGFGIYPIKNNNNSIFLSYGSAGPNGKYVDGKKVDLNPIQLEETPLITDKDIKEYHWKTHIMVLNDDFLKKRNLSEKDKETITTNNPNPLERYKGVNQQIQSRLSKIYFGSKLLNTDSNLNAVMLTINGEKIYTSGFSLPVFSSCSPAEITISDYNLNSIIIENRRQSDDLRKDKRIYDYLKKSGKLIE